MSHLNRASTDRCRCSLGVDGGGGAGGAGGPHCWGSCLGAGCVRAVLDGWESGMMLPDMGD